MDPLPNTTYTFLRSRAPFGSEYVSAKVLLSPETGGVGVTETTVGGWLAAGDHVPLSHQPVLKPSDVNG